MDNLLISATIEYVKEVFATDFSGHDFFHTMRVYQMATKIAMEEKADLQIVQLAALLHDVDDRKLSPETCENKDRAVAYMRSKGLSEDTITRVKDIIGEVSFVGTDSVVPKTLEGKCVQDADRLDAMGAIGVARTFAFGGSHGRAMHDPDGQDSGSSIAHFYDKLLLLKQRMNTDTGRKLARHRHEFLQTFLAEFLAEWEGKC